MKKFLINKIYDEPWGVPESILDNLDEALQPDGIEKFSPAPGEFFIEKAEPLGRVVTFEQEAFIKFMVEDKDFFFQVYPLVNQNWFFPFELRDIVRTIKDLYYSGIQVTYNSILEAMTARYDMADESRAISWKIIESVLEECQGDECFEGLDVDWYKVYFIERLLKTIKIPTGEWI